jgi:RNA polymerase sigma-70 factor, ECF subfamily
MARARDGDEGAWAWLYAAHGKRLVVWLQTLPPADVCNGAEDIAADAWLTAAAKIADFSGDEHDFAGWLFTIARNVSLSRRQTAQRRRTTPVPVDVAASGVWGTAEDPFGTSDGRDSTSRLLGRLPEREAQVVACIDVVGLDVATTSRVLGISTGAVRVARHRALGRLRTMVTADELGIG